MLWCCCLFVCSFVCFLGHSNKPLPNSDNSGSIFLGLALALCKIKQSSFLVNLSRLLKFDLNSFNFSVSSNITKACTDEFALFKIYEINNSI